MTQIARNLTDLNDGFLRGKHYLILDRDTKTRTHSAAFSSAKAFKLFDCRHDRPIWGSFAERFVRSIKEECLSRMIFFGPVSLQRAVRQFMAHYHIEHNHQGLENRLPQPAPVNARPPPLSCSTPTAPRRNAQLLRSGRSLTKVDSFRGQFAVAHAAVFTKSRESNAANHSGQRSARCSACRSSGSRQRSNGPACSAFR
jgi:Integrase core domain